MAGKKAGLPPCLVSYFRNPEPGCRWLPEVP
jgi:hypothetical protein